MLRFLLGFASEKLLNWLGFELRRGEMSPALLEEVRSSIGGYIERWGYG